VPWAIRAVRAFLVLTGYYRCFIQDCGTVSELFHMLLCKDAFKWCSEAKVAFCVLPSMLMMTLVLQLTVLDHDFILNVVLHQGSGPVAFFSKSIAPRHAKLVTHEHELIGLVYAVRHWRPYLWGHPFLIRTDHYSLKFLLDQKLARIPHPQWVSKSLRFDFCIEYKLDVTNVVTDALSHHDSEAGAELSALSAPSFHIFDTLRQ
jgi:hypothetical protein